MTLRNRLALISTALAAVVLALALTTVYFYARRVELRRVAADAREQLRDFTDARGHDAAYVRAHGGRLLAFVAGTTVVYSDPQVRPLLADAQKLGLLRPGASGTVTGAGDGAGYRVAVGSAGARRLAVVFSPLAAAHAGLRRLLLATLLVGALGIALAGLVAWLAARRWLSPLDAIAATAARVRLQALGHRTGVGGAGELGAVGAALDEMLARLEAAVGEQRRFLQDVSHELRTPLTIARGHLEVLAANPAADADEVGAEIALALDELTRMGSLVEGLLELARAGALQSLRPERIEVRPLLDEVARQFEAVADRRFAVAAPDDLAVTADPPAIRRVLDNLVRNAIEASGEGTTVGLAAAARDGAVELTVRDHGAGIAPKIRERLFDRFVHASSGGVGLGLAISQALVHAHGGSITGDDADGGGAVFTVRLPRT